MLDTQSRLEGEIAELRTQREDFRIEKIALEERLRFIESIISAPINGETEDVAAFGRNAWVYCNQHMRAHQTGWCSVSSRDKVALGVTTAQEATQKCREWGFKLDSDTH